MSYIFQGMNRAGPRMVSILTSMYMYRGGSRNLRRGILLKECVQGAPKRWGDHAPFAKLNCQFITCTLVSGRQAPLGLTKPVGRMDQQKGVTQRTPSGSAPDVAVRTGDPGARAADPSSRFLELCHLLSSI
jgi:hypothetical protein